MTWQDRGSDVGSDAQVAPLSEAQKQLWTLAQMSEFGSLAYHVPLNLILRGPLRLDLLRQAIQSIVERHEALRTTFDSSGEWQRIHSKLRLTIPVVDLTGLPRDEGLAKWFFDLNQKPFDMTNGPLIRVHILKLEEDTHLLAIGIHHILCDGWSMLVIANELTALYSAACEGRVAPLEGPAQYRDYVAWQNRQRQTDAMRVDEAYWLEQLSGKLPILDLPTDRPRPAVPSYQASRQTFWLDATLTEQLRTVARTHGCTLYMVLLSAYALLLHRLSGQEEILINSPTDGRGMEDSQEIVGYCTHYLPIRTALAATQSFADYLAMIKTTVLNMFDHQDYPFAWLLNRLHEEGQHEQIHDSVASSIMRAGFNFDPPVRMPKMTGLTLEAYSQPINFMPLDLVFTVLDVDGALLCDLDYNTDLFDGSTIERWASHLQVLFSQIVANAERAVPAATHTLLTDVEREQLLVEWNATDVDYPKKLIHQMVSEQVERTPDALAAAFCQRVGHPLITRDDPAIGPQLTYRELNARANQLAHHLQSLGVGPDIVVAIHVERSLDLSVAILAILKAGGAYLPLDVTLPTARVALMVEHAKPLVLLTHQQHLPANSFDRLLDGMKIVCLDSDLPADLPTDNPPSTATLNDLGYVLYTSGSTGQPKGVALPHAALANLIQWQLEHFAWMQPARTLQFASVGFDASFHEIFSAWCSGGSVILIPEALRRNSESLHQVLREQAIERLFVPFIGLQQLAEIDPYQPPITALREVITAGEQLQRTPSLVNFFKRMPNCRLANHYGPTETHVVTVYFLEDDPDDWAALPPIGRPIANTQVYILDQNLQPVPIGVYGELYLGGVQLARGYLHQPELTAERFVELQLNGHQNSHEQKVRLYKTGDFCRFLPSGNIEFMGRIDNQIKIRGFRVELAEVELLLSRHPAVQEAVVNVYGESVNKRLVAYYVATQEVKAHELRAFMQEIAPDYMVPAAFVELESLPLTSSNKVDRRALPAPDRAAFDEEIIPPSTPTEAEMAALWSELLQLEQVSIHSSFFDLGGHSLLMTQLASRIRRHFNVELSLRYLFEQVTIAGQATLVEALQSLSIPASTEDAIETTRDVGEL